MPTCKVPGGLGLEPTQCLSCHIVLGAANHTASPDERSEEVDPSSRWEELPSHTAVGEATAWPLVGH